MTDPCGTYVAPASCNPAPPSFLPTPTLSPAAGDLATTGAGLDLTPLIGLGLVAVIIGGATLVLLAIAKRRPPE